MQIMVQINEYINCRNYKYKTIKMSKNCKFKLYIEGNSKYGFFAAEIVTITEESIVLKNFKFQLNTESIWYVRIHRKPETAYLSFPCLCARSKRFVSVAFLNRDTGRTQHRQCSSCSML